MSRVTGDDYDYDAAPSLMIGTIQQTVQLDQKRRKRVKRRPIGFTADIDSWVEDDQE